MFFFLINIYSIMLYCIYCIVLNSIYVFVVLLFNKCVGSEKENNNNNNNNKNISNKIYTVCIVAIAPLIFLIVFGLFLE